MSRFTDKITTWGRGLLGSFRAFPVEAAFALITFVFYLLVWHGVTLPGGYGEPVLYCALPLFILIFCLHRFAADHRGSLGWILYVAAAFLWIPLYLWAPEKPDSHLIVLYGAAFVLLFAGTGRMDDKTYGAQMLYILWKGLMAVLIGGVLMAVWAVLVASVSYLLFDGTAPDAVYQHPIAGIGIVIVPMLCCTFVSEPQDGKMQGKRFLTIVVDYILSPALLLYALILYLYIFRILWHWELPAGGVAWMTGGFLTVSLLCILLREQIDHPHLNGFFRWFPAIALAPIVLLWIGTIRRVSDYGLTQPRVYLILAASLLTLFVGMLLFRKSRSFQWMSVILAASFLLLTYIPGIRAEDWEKRSQARRLSRLESDTSPADTLAVVPSEAAPEVLVRETRVDCGDYTVLLSPSSYYKYEDKECVIFYADTERKTELLRCNILERLSDGASSDRFVYKNDRYLAVFDWIEDNHLGGEDRGYNFIVSQYQLFAKPDSTP